MATESPLGTWYEEFFSGAALELWRRAIPVETTEQELRFLDEALSAPNEGQLLDIPCGNGRLSLPLSLLGYKVTGVDSCEEFLLEANKSANAYESDISFVNTDMRKLSWHENFDAAFCMGNSFGYFNRDGSQQFIQAVSESLKSGAKFVLDSAMVAECFLVNGGEREWVQVGDMYMLIENHYNCRLSCVETSYTFMQKGKEERRQSVHWIYTAGELCHMLEQSGFAVLDLLSSTDFEPFTLGSDRLLVVSQKS